MYEAGGTTQAAVCKGMEEKASAAQNPHPFFANTSLPEDAVDASDVKTGLPRGSPTCDSYESVTRSQHWNLL